MGSLKNTLNFQKINNFKKKLKINTLGSLSSSILSETLSFMNIFQHEYNKIKHLNTQFISNLILFQFNTFIDVVYLNVKVYYVYVKIKKNKIKNEGVIF